MCSRSCTLLYGIEHFKLVAAQMRFELCAGPWAARVPFSASGVMRGMVPAWLRRGSIDGAAPVVGRGRNAFRIQL